MDKHKIYFPNLDALRSIAALLVINDHIISGFLYVYFPQNVIVNNPFNSSILFSGSLGVKLFFVLSGFLITYLLLKELDETRKINFKNFLIRRVLRIWPVYFIVVFFVFFIYAGVKNIMNNPNDIHESFLMSLFFLSNYDLIRIMDNPELFPNGMLSLTWSVSVEEQFYLIWPILFMLVGLRNIKSAILSTIAIGVFFMIIFHDNLNVVYRHTISNFIFLGSGAFLAYIQINKSKFLIALDNVPKNTWIVIYMILLLNIIFTKDILYDIQYGNVLYSLLIALFLFATMYFLTSKESKLKIDISKYSFLMHLAPYTYGLYMYHRIVGFICETLAFKFLKLEKSFSVDFVMLITQLFLIYVAVRLSYKFIEKPLLKLKNKFSLFQR